MKIPLESESEYLLPVMVNHRHVPGQIVVAGHMDYHALCIVDVKIMMNVQMPF